MAVASQNPRAPDAAGSTSLAEAARRRPPDSARQHLTAPRKRMRSAATSPSTRCSTTSPRFQSSITSAGSTISTHGSSAPSAIRTCASSKIPCACCAPSSSRHACSSRSISRYSIRSPAHRHEIARSAPARLVEEYYKSCGRGTPRKRSSSCARRGCSRPSRPSSRARRIRSGCPLRRWTGIARISKPHPRR